MPSVNLYADWLIVMNVGQRETPRIHKYGKSKTTRIMMATVRHVTSSSGLRKFQADGFLFDWVYYKMRSDQTYCNLSWTWKFSNVKLHFTVACYCNPRWFWSKSVVVVLSILVFNLFAHQHTWACTSRHVGLREKDTCLCVLVLCCRRLAECFCNWATSCLRPRNIYRVRQKNVYTL